MSDFLKYSFFPYKRLTNFNKKAKNAAFAFFAFYIIYYSFILTETPFISTPSSAGIIRYLLPLTTFVSMR